ncbi:unnamed protein product [Closterium sp. Naga37s-1]|nr:unnamed protein product [Closterium sp. Naga37s-1]
MSAQFAACHAAAGVSATLVNTTQFANVSSVSHAVKPALSFTSHVRRLASHSKGSVARSPGLVHVAAISASMSEDVEGNYLSSEAESTATALSNMNSEISRAPGDDSLQAAPLTQAGSAVAEPAVAAPAVAESAVAEPAVAEPAVAGPNELVEDGAVIVRDDLDELLHCLPGNLRGNLLQHPRRSELLEVVLDLGRRPEARFLGDGGAEYLQEAEVTRADLESACESIGAFGGDNRAGVEGTLHRISAIRNRKGDVVGLTCRVGRAVTGHVDMVRDLLHHGQSLLFLGRPGVGKTTVIREIARVLADEMQKRVVLVDTSNEIGGDGDVPHPAIGGARRMQVPDPALQHRVMVEAVENHMPQVVIVDEIGTEAEALACRTIAERGVMLVGTAHGQLLENLIKNPTLCDLVGGVQTVTLGDEEARSRGTQKSVLERTAPPTFPVLIEMRERHFWVAHQTDRSVDALLHGKRPQVEVRTRDESFHVTIDRRLYDRNGTSSSSSSSSSSTSSANPSSRMGTVGEKMGESMFGAGSAGPGVVLGGRERERDLYWMAGSDDEGFDWMEGSTGTRYEFSYGRNGGGGSGKGAGREVAVEQTYSWAAKLGECGRYRYVSTGCFVWVEGGTSTRYGLSYGKNDGGGSGSGSGSGKGVGREVAVEQTYS